jgi:hypothetical protein
MIEAIQNKYVLLSTAVGGFTSLVYDQVITHSIGTMYVIVNTAIAFSISYFLNKNFPKNEK